MKVLKMHAASGGLGVKNCLDVCYLQSVEIAHSEQPAYYYMTLLAHAAVHKQKEMMKFLLKNGASKSQS